MKTLTLAQPFAALVVTGWCDVANQHTKRTYRGALAIHVANERAPDAEIDALLQIDLPDNIRKLAESAHIDNKLAGHIIGSVDLIDCTRKQISPWAVAGYWHFVFRNAHVAEREIVAPEGMTGWWEWKR